jgi:hypothetical protein
MVGQMALHSVAAGDTRVLSLLHSANSDVEKSITLLLADGVLFEHALAAAYCDRRLLGRSWSAFNIDASAPVDSSSPDLPAFEAELATAMIRSDGSIGKLKIDPFERSPVSEDGAALGRTVHYAIYSEGLPVSNVEFLGDALKRETRRPVHEGGSFTMWTEGAWTSSLAVAKQSAIGLLIPSHGTCSPLRVRSSL